MASAPWRVATLSGLVPFHPERPGKNIRREIRLAPNGTFPQGTVLGEYSANPGVFAPYAAGNTDGTEVPRGLLEFSVVVDAGGNISYPVATGLTTNIGQLTTMFCSGYFATGDLVGLDTNAVSALGRLVEGTVTSGILCLLA